jgi:predicted dehydrogenase
MAETAQLADTATFRAATPRYLNIVEGADVEDWGTMLITFDDGTVAAISAADTVLGGIRNQMAIYGAKAVVLCNINPNDLVQAYAPDASVFGNEYIVEKIETKAGWTAPQPDEEWTTVPAGDPGLHGVRGHGPRAPLQRPARPRRDRGHLRRLPLRDRRPPDRPPPLPHVAGPA